MKLFKNYKKLYNIELNNRKKYEELYKELKTHDEEWQKENTAKLRLEIRKLREDKANLTFNLVDIKGFLEQETVAKEKLLKQRDTLKKKVKKLEEEIKNGK